MRKSPRQSGDTHTVLRATQARRAGVQHGLILAGIQVSPLPFDLMIVQGSGRATFRALPLLLRLMPEVDVNGAFVQSEIDTVDRGCPLVRRK